MTLRRAGRANYRTAALHHVGRKSGRPYVTPLAAEPVAGGFVIPMPYGDDTDWCRNLLAAGQATLDLNGEAIAIVNPRVVEIATVQDQVRAAQVKNWTRLRIRRCLRVDRADSGDPGQKSTRARTRPALDGMKNTTIVETHSLSKRYASGVLAVESIDMSVRRGEVYGFLGPNGAGKTTTLRMLVGLIRPTSGTAIVAGHRPGEPAGLASIGSLIEGPGFYPYLSGRENLRVVADLLSVSRKRVDEVLDLIEMTSRAGRKFGTYSTGMKMRIGVAAALLKDPELLILDEPTNGLDPQGMAEMRKLIKDIGQGDRTVLISSHLLGEVEQICDRVGVISNGKLVVQSSVQELLGEKGILVRAKPSDRAGDVLARMFGPEAVIRENGHFHLKIDPATAWKSTANSCRPTSASASCGLMRNRWRRSSSSSQERSKDHDPNNQS
jgi:ABC-2 type transport system ATP-binding protein